jgi:hypothetical protein
MNFLTRLIASEVLLDKIHLSPEQIAKLHNVSIDQIEDQIKKGMPTELEEHTTHPGVALEIVLDHLKETPTYYDKLKKAEL